MSCSVSSVRSERRGPADSGSCCSARARHQSRWRTAIVSCSPDASRRSTAYWRMVSSRRKRCPVAVTSDLSTSRATQVDDLPARDGAAGAHVLGRLQGEAAGEDAQAAEEHALLAGEQLVAPLDRGAQRLLARARRAAAGGEDVEAVAQARRDLIQRQGRHAGRGQLDGQRHAVQAPADLVDRRPVVVGGAEARVRGCALREQAARLGQRRDAPGHLALAVQRLAARGEDAHAGAGAQQVFRQARTRVDHVLAVVEHDDGLTAGQVRGKGLLRRAPGGDRDAHGQRGRLGHQRAVGQPGELDEPDAVGDRIDAGQRLDRQARLPAAARADQREQADAVEQADDLAALTLAADERGQRPGAGSRLVSVTGAGTPAARGTGRGSRGRARRPARRRAAGAGSGTAPAPAGGGRWRRTRA